MHVNFLGRQNLKLFLPSNIWSFFYFIYTQKRQNSQHQKDQMRKYNSINFEKMEMVVKSW